MSAIVFTNYRSTKKQESLAKRYYDLFILGEASKLDDMVFGELIKFRDTIFMPFAEHYYVNLTVKEGKYEKAIQLLFDLIGSTKNKPELSNVMKIRLTSLIMQHNMKTYYYKVADILRKATKNKKDPYYHVMRLLLGQLLIESDIKEEALKILKELNHEDTTPEDVKFFSGAILSNYLE